MKKQLVLWALVCALVLPLFGCGRSSSENGDSIFSPDGALSLLVPGEGTSDEPSSSEQSSVYYYSGEKGKVYLILNDDGTGSIVVQSKESAEVPEISSWRITSNSPSDLYYPSNCVLIQYDRYTAGSRDFDLLKIQENGDLKLLDHPNMLLYTSVLLKYVSGDRIFVMK
ncbi:MAG: hypothetical protein II739_02950 [Clostridia bacterium]|nr:hypothetical protein [Clostridia bacterium]